MTMRVIAFAFAFALLFTPPARADILPPNEFTSDAQAVEAMVNAHYAYLDRLSGSTFSLTPTLEIEASTVRDRAGLLRFMERVLLLLADHHAITGNSFHDSWAVIPSYSDLWIEAVGDEYRITAVRDNSPASAAGISAGDRMIAFGDAPTTVAVASFWTDLGLERADQAQAGFAARILAAGRRDRPRVLTVQRGDQTPSRVTLPSLYESNDRATPVTVNRVGSTIVVRINNSLGDNSMIADFDTAMASLPSDAPLVLDLTNTASGGNTVVARAIMGWFTDKPAAYQIHSSPREERETGIARQWIEQVLPRSGDRYHSGPVTVRVGRWTGSMGEGLAIGMAALGARLEGGRMAGLLGAIEDIRLPSSGLVFKLPVERLMHIDGTPRENVIAQP